MAPKAAKAKQQNELVYVIAGDEPTLVNAQCTQLVDRLIPQQEKATGLLVADTDRITITEVLDELRTLPFLTKKRVVVIRNADKFISANREILETYFENPCPTGILVLTVSSWPGNTRLAKKLPDVGTLVEVEAPKGAEITRRLIAYSHDAHSKGFERGAAELLIELAGDNLPRLYTEVDKLAVYAADEKSITTAHVESLVGHNRLFDAFAVIESCLHRQPAPAVERLRRLFAEDKSAEYSTIGAFAFHFRRLFTAKKLLDEGCSQYEVAGKARIWYNKDAQFALLKRLTLKQIGDYLQQLAATDYAIKKGLAQPRIAIEQLVLRMASL
ncbi:MAG: DNA polymerase III subunit delta [Sedimentisphaerales bacterium]|jgi:DNA polymerase-3 subunit delta